MKNEGGKSGEKMMFLVVRLRVKKRKDFGGFASFLFTHFKTQFLQIREKIGVKSEKKKIGLLSLSLSLNTGLFVTLSLSLSLNTGLFVFFFLSLVFLGRVGFFYSSFFILFIYLFILFIIF